MNIRYLAALALLGALASTSVQAAVGSWSPVYTDKTNGIFISEYSSLVSAGTPPLPTNFAGSRIIMSASSVSGTAMLTSFWGTLAGPIGVTATVTGISSNIVAPVSVTSSATTLTTNNSFHDVGASVSNTTGQLYKIRAAEFRQ